MSVYGEKLAELMETEAYKASTDIGQFHLINDLFFNKFSKEIESNPANKSAFRRIRALPSNDIMFKSEVSYPSSLEFEGNIRKLVEDGYTVKIEDGKLGVYTKMHSWRDSFGGREFLKIEKYEDCTWFMYNVYALSKNFAEEKPRKDIKEFIDKIAVRLEIPMETKVEVLASAPE